ncbi:MAG: VRR-NUC domain-containing protein [Myxococcota bacterium]
MAVIGSPVDVLSTEAPLRLAEGYYLDNLEQVVLHALQRYRAILHDEEAAALERFLALPLGPRRLYARLYLRQGPLFRLSQLDYPEVGTLAEALRTLEGAGFVARCGLPVNPDDTREFLWLFTADELKAAARVAGLRVSSRKEDLVADIRGSQEASARLRASELFVERLQAPVFDLAQLLFFGNLGQDLSEFVRVSLQVARYPDYELAQDLPLFPSREALEAHLDAVAFESRPLPLDQPTLLLGHLREAVAGLVESVPTPAHAWRLDPRRCFARVAYACARELERQDVVDGVLDAYVTLVRHAPQSRIRAEAADRLGLLARRAGVPERFTTESAALLADPTLDDVARFAVETRAALVTGGVRPRRRLCEAPVVELALQPAGHLGPKPQYRGASGEPVSVEHATLEALGGGLHAENALYRTLFGLLFWDVIYARVPGMFQHRFQSAPLDLASEHFHRNRRVLVEGRLGVLAGTSLGAEVRAAWERHRGTINACVDWSEYTAEQLVAAADALGGRLLPLLERLAWNPRRHARGLPDLLVLAESGPMLVEVKGPGDQLHLEQRLWHDALLRMGLEVRLARVRRADS